MKLVEFKRPDGKNLGIEIIRYAPNDQTRNTTPDRHRHNFHSIFFIQNGSSEQEIDFEPYTLQADSVMIIPKGSVHWEIASKNLEGFVILFSDDFFSEVQKYLLQGFLQYAIASGKLLINLDASQRENVLAYFNLLFQEQEGDESQNLTFLLQNLMLALLNKLEGLIQHIPEAQSFTATRQLFQQFTVLAEEHFKTQQPLEFYTSELHLTSRKLNAAVKSVTGQTAAHYLIHRTLLEARRELCFSGKSIKEIAIELGYENQYYFSRIFKSKAGMSPEQFRRAFAQ